MLRTSCVATRLAAGHADNALPQTAAANINCRIAPTSTADQVKTVLDRIIADTGVKITTRGGGRDNAGGKPSPIHPALLAATQELTRKMFNDVPVIPTMSTGATDGRFLRAAGIPTSNPDLTIDCTLQERRRRHPASMSRFVRSIAAHAEPRER